MKSQKIVLLFHSILKNQICVESTFEKLVEDLYKLCDDIHMDVEIGCLTFKLIKEVLDRRGVSW
jgi:hypothetical protein